MKEFAHYLFRGFSHQDPSTCDHSPFMLKRPRMTSVSATMTHVFLRLLLPALLLFPGLGYGEDRLVILAEDDAAPWSFKDGTGCANDVVKAAFAAAKVDIDVQVMPYERAKQMVLKGSAVACLSMSWDSAYDGKVLFADKPLFTCQCDYLHNLASPLNAKNEGELVGKREARPGLDSGIG